MVLQFVDFEEKFFSNKSVINKRNIWHVKKISFSSNGPFSIWDSVGLV